MTIISCQRILAASSYWILGYSRVVLSAQTDVVEELALFDVLHEQVYIAGSLD
jgi:hypothetical protein